ncbi:hypothetical protein [Jatrophihabitans fulvus]
MRSSDERSGLNRAAHGFAALAVGAGTAWAATVTDPSGKLAAADASDAEVRMAQSLYDVVDAEEGRRESADATEDAIENPQELPSIIEPRDKFDVFADEVSPEVSEPTVTDSLAPELRAAMTEAPEAVAEAPDGLANEVSDALAEMGPAPDMFGGPMEPGPMGEPGGDAAMGGGPI